MGVACLVALVPRSLSLAYDGWFLTGTTPRRGACGGASDTVLRWTSVGSAVSRRRRIVTLGALVALVATTALAAGFTAGRGREASGNALDTISIRGVPVVASAKIRATQRELGISNVFRIGQAGDQAFYRFSQHALECYGAGFADRPGEIGISGCGNVMISDYRPVIDFTSVELRGREPSVHLVRVQGITADGVKAITVAARDGRPLLSLPVRHNVYSVSDPPQDEVGTIAALDAEGHVVWSERINPAGASPP